MAFMVYKDKETASEDNKNLHKPHKPSIDVQSLKTFFVTLCEARLRDKFAYLFREFAHLDDIGVGGSGTSLSRRSLARLLLALSQMPEFLGESKSFGVSREIINAAVDQCFRQTHVLLREEDFIRWLLREPQIIVWLPTFYRLLSAKSTKHGMRCAHCKSEDIVGMRYGFEMTPLCDGTNVTLVVFQIPVPALLTLWSLPTMFLLWALQSRASH